MPSSNRRGKLICGAVALAILVGAVVYWRASRSNPSADWSRPADADAALAELRDGNARFMRSARTLSTDTAHDAEHRHETAHKQHPFAVILTCADSRLCPEFIFDQRPGSIFEVRNAGNVVDEDVLASFEYAVDHLHVPLMLVMGHKGCGAIHAVCEAGDKPLPAHLQDLQKHMKGIQQLIDTGNSDHGADWLDQLSKENARFQAKALLRDSEILKKAIERGDVHLKCGVYDMETGSVIFFDP